MSSANNLSELQRKISTFRRIVILTEGFSVPPHAKTAISLLRYRGDHIIAVLDGSVSQQSAQELFGAVGQIPVVASLDNLEADALFLGTSIAGGKLPPTWKPIILQALSRGIDVVSGNHEFLVDDADYVREAAENDCHLIDVRRNAESSISSGEPFRPGCLRVQTVGQDCSLGKMVVSLEVQLELVRRGADAKFIATGQTGIMISGEGIPVDCVVADFVNGSVESLVRRQQHHDILVIEGQGSISHPSFSAVTLGLLHGAAPQGLIYCYEIGRERVKGLPQIPLLTHERMMNAYLTNAALRHPAKLIGIAINGRNVSTEEGEAERVRMQAEFNLPACDVYRDGAGLLADAVMRLHAESTK